MAVSSNETRDGNIDVDNTHRRAVGLFLGGGLGAVIGWALGGGWDWIYLRHLPIRFNWPSIILTPLVAGLGGALWGLVTTWPRRGTTGLFRGSALIGLSLLIYNLIVEVSRELFLGSRLLVLWTLTFIPALILTLTLRGVAALTIWVGQRRPALRWPAGTSTCLLVLGLVLGIVGTIDEFYESLQPRRQALQTMSCYAEAQGWSEYELDPVVHILSEGGLVRVHLSDQQVIECLVPFVKEPCGESWAEPTCGP
jgi:hypothetical protein